MHTTQKRIKIQKIRHIDFSELNYYITFKKYMRPVCVRIAKQLCKPRVQMVGIKYARSDTIITIFTFFNLRWIKFRRHFEWVRVLIKFVGLTSGGWNHLDYYHNDTPLARPKHQWTTRSPGRKNKCFSFGNTENFL